MEPVTPPYAHSPLTIVIAEIRHSRATPILGSQLETLEESLKDLVPIPRTDHIQMLTAAVGAGGQLEQLPSRPVVAERFSSRDRHLAITLGPESVTVETTEYTSWTWFREVINRALTARQSVQKLDGLVRLGLRMVDEVRVPDHTDGWRHWFHQSLLGPAELVTDLGYRPQQQQGIIQSATGAPDRRLLFRYGPAEGQAVVDSPHLVRPAAAPSGEYFLLDFDSSQEPDDGGIPELHPGQITETFDQLHSESKSLFEAVISSALREEVFNAS